MLRANFEAACKKEKARVFGGFHEDDLDVGECDEAQDTGSTALDGSDNNWC